MWSLWPTEHLTKLRISQGTDVKNKWPVGGDLVLIRDDSWKLGIVTKLLKGNDGMFRVIHLRVVAGIMIQPIVKLYLLELNVFRTEC